MNDTRTVGTVARLSGLTVRTLHHYDEIGLLTPSERGENGYRLYTDEDIERLRKILVYRELSLGLDEIKTIVNDAKDASESLLAERVRITDRIQRLRAIADMIDATIAHERQGVRMTAEEKLSVFGDFDPTEHEEEAKQRWGGTAAYEQSARRTNSYTQQDWEAIKAEADGIYAAFVALMNDEVDPTSEEAAKLVDAHRTHISRWFYECSPEIHSGLGQMYLEDERFRANIDQSGHGLAEYLAAAIAARYER